MNKKYRIEPLSLRKGITYLLLLLLSIAIVMYSRGGDFVIKNNCGYVKMPGVTWTESVKDAYFDYDNQCKIINEYCIENQTQKLLSIYNELLDGDTK